MSSSREFLMSDILLFEKHFREMETNMEVSFEIILNFNFSGFHQVVKKASRFPVCDCAIKRSQGESKYKGRVQF